MQLQACGRADITAHTLLVANLLAIADATVASREPSCSSAAAARTMNRDACRCATASATTNWKHGGDMGWIGGGAGAGAWVF